MRFFGWFRRASVVAVKESRSGYRYTFTDHDQSKGAQAFARSKAEALAIRRQARIDSRDVLHRVK